ncbi:MAG: hypothetical protein ACR2HO_08025 [Rubrobacteraceae bacterium]|nr:hypothetical protein [Rubrobacter sp.]
MDPVVLTYVAYLVISVALTVWVARVLSSNGRAFLVDVFAGDGDLADSVNRLLVVGFYLINLGYVSLALKIGGDVMTLQGTFEVLSRKVGLVLLVLGVMHLFNLLIFSRVRRSASKSRAAKTANAANA